MSNKIWYSNLILIVVIIMFASSCSKDEVSPDYAIHIVGTYTGTKQ